MFKEALIFIAGAAVGFMAGELLLKKRYESIADQEINSVKEVYGKKTAALAKQAANKPDLSVYGEALRTARKTDMEKADRIIKENGYREDDGREETGREFELINAEKFSALNGFDKISLTLYSDGLLADETDEVVDIGESVGQTAISELKNGGEEAVYVRNAKNATEYELTIDPRTYTEVTGIFYNNYRE